MLILKLLGSYSTRCVRHCTPRRFTKYNPTSNTQVAIDGFINTKDKLETESENYTMMEEQDSPLAQTPTGIRVTIESDEIGL